MGCYHPLRMRYLGVDELTGKKKYSFTSMQGQHFKVDDSVYTDNFNLMSKGTDFFLDPYDVLVPCHKCIGCRLDYSRRWADRLMIELDHSKTALFLTLTYSPENVVLGKYDQDLDVSFFTLVKKHLQDFNKRLRYYFSDKEIRFYAVGEYGDNTLRPHYHGIYFGLSLDDFKDLEFYKLNEHHQPMYMSRFLDSIWKHGFVTIANVSWQSCAYVARYNLKKLAQGKDNFALERGCLPEFSLMSRNPGIAGYFPYDHPEFFKNPRDDIVLSDLHGVRKVGSVKLPSYLFNKMNDTESKESYNLSLLGIVNPDLYDIIKSERQEASTERFLKELSNTNLNEFDYLDLKEKVHEKSSSLLVRSL